MTREEWLTRAADDYLWSRLQEPRPEKLRISVGFPRASRKAIGQCWGPHVSADGTTEIFISPTLGAFDAIHVLLHELIHAAVGLEVGHKGSFKRVAKRVGLTGRMTATVPDTDLAAAIHDWLTVLPDYPHAPMTLAERKKPGSRLLKAVCEGCGYTVRVTRQWIDVAEPICPNTECDNYQEPMTCE